MEVWEYEPEEEELGKVKNRKRLPKDSEDSEATEYETIKSGDEEHLKDNLENEKVLKPLLFKLPPGETFEPFEEIHYIDEYDNNFVSSSRIVLNFVETLFLIIYKILVV